MSSAFGWTDVEDARLRRLRAAGQPWRAIAAELGTTLWSAIERGRRIGAPRPRPTALCRREDDGRQPLPPGHPRTWRAITDGTLLDGAPYPLPVFTTHPCEQ